MYYKLSIAFEWEAFTKNAGPNDTSRILMSCKTLRASTIADRQCHQCAGRRR